MSAQETVSVDEITQALKALLEAHSEEVEESVVARMHNMDLGIPMKAETVAEMRPTAIESVKAMIESIEKGGEWDPVLPPALAFQLRYLARQEVSLEAVMRSVVIIGGVFVDALVQKLDDRLARAALRYMATWQSKNLDMIMTSFATEYTTELERINRSPTRELGEQVKKLLEGRSGDTRAIDYRLDACHIGLIAVGEKVDVACRRLAEELGCDLLIVPDAESTFWVWLGAPRPIDFSELERSVSAVADSLILGAGEPRSGVGGWRLTHQEAQAAAPVALREGPGLVRYSNVALLASALYDESTGRSLMDRYLKPLDRHRDGESLRGTLRVYFELNCNAASAAAALGVNRHTVQRRLKRVEEAIGEPPATRQAEVDVALRLERLTTQKPSDSS